MTTEDSIELRPETAISYLERRGAFDPGAATAADASALGGGVSNRVIRVSGRSRCVVLKQPRSNLAVDDDWPADVSRVHNEAAAARAYAAVAREAGVENRTDDTDRWSIAVPEVIFEDERDHVLAMECAPETTNTWKAELLDGTVDTGIARTLGRFLGVSHRSAADRTDLRERFQDSTPFEQLRVAPYHRTTATRHPDLAGYIEAEAARVLGVGKTLVHGDYSPKNVLVDRAERTDVASGTAPNGVDDPSETPIGDGTASTTDPGSGSNSGPRPDSDDLPLLWLIDFEVAHWGDPAFDVAFMCNHLFIKSVHSSNSQDEYLDAARAFWHAYDDVVPWGAEREVVRELAVLMLARVDGKSPVEYIDEETGAILREIARRALTDDIETIEGYVSLLRRVSA